MTSKSPADFRLLNDEEYPTVGQSVPSDIYIHLPRAERFVRYVCAGDVWDESRESVFRKHSNQKLFINIGGDIPVPPLSSQQTAPPEIQVFNDTVGKELDDLFRSVASASEENAAQTIAAMESLSQKIIEVVAPDVANLRENIIQQSKYIMVMTDAAAITSIAIMIAMAHGFDSRKIFRDLSMGILLMDAPLSELPEVVVIKYYQDRSTLTNLEWEEIRRHPAHAHELVSSKLKTVPTSVLQLILNHHELYNSKGYPRQIRNESLPPIVRSLCLAVDVFEVMKRENLNGREIDMLTALTELKEATIEPHLRRHNQKLVSQAIQYISTTPTT
ncbi:MAG: HD domain-containing phosphohydrolase [Bdellovibrionota bacterium]